MAYPIAVVGAGLAGLYAARLLHAAGVASLVLEARDRFGGRILSAGDDGAPSEDGFDLGPSWFWPHMQPAMAELVASLGLTAFAQHGEGDVLFERMSREGPQRYASHGQEPMSYRLAGGTAALVRALVTDVPMTSVHTGHRVTALALEGDHVSLTVEHAGGRAERIAARAVIAALPPRLLAATITLTPTPDADALARWRATPTWMAPHAKFFALYDRPFWRDVGLSGTAQSMVGPMPEIHDATTASGRAALFGFLGIGAEQRAALGEAAITDACIAQLVRLFGDEARRPRTTLLKDWAADPFTATPADRVPGGHPEPQRAPWVTGAWSERLVLGGSEASPVEPGYLAGAVVAAERAVREILGRFGTTREAR